ncbi:ABC-type sulfate transport system substrate-binding protein [Devosia sp. UYZn731]|uniref:hypothetical protein n=1 Tax=Devosia sp. UYZn731 TaxID=3156345 RepID=UPI003393C5E3
MADIDSLIVKLNENMAEAEKLKLEDGDVLVITSSHALSQHHAVAIRDAARATITRLGVRAEVMVLDAGLHAALLKTSQLPKAEEPLTDVQRSVRDGTFSVRSADISDRSIGFKAQGS